jgi:hypothetical protein
MVRNNKTEDIPEIEITPEMIEAAERCLNAPLAGGELRIARTQLRGAG